MFNITRNSGFHITFDNGFAVSVQWGNGTYSDNHGSFTFSMNRDAEVEASNTAEIAVFDPTGAFVPLSSGDDVMGWLTADQVLQVLMQTAAISPGEQLRLTPPVQGAIT